MIPPQTSEVLLGAFVALLYAIALTVIGSMSLAAFMGQGAIGRLRSHIGLSGFIWLGFVMGQGFLGVVWLTFALAGVLYARLVWTIVALGCTNGCLVFFLNWRQTARSVRVIWLHVLSHPGRSPWYLWIGIAMGLVGLLGGLTALLPPDNDDALRWYLPAAKVIAAGHRVAMQPFNTPHSALYPLQVEIHWAALFGISNETAVTVWDYLCAVSFLVGIALLGRFLTTKSKCMRLAQ